LMISTRDDRFLRHITTIGHQLTTNLTIIKRVIKTVDMKVRALKSIFPKIQALRIRDE
jgi:hypothetical protein